MKEPYVVPTMEIEKMEMDDRYMDNQFSGPTDDFTKERNDNYSDGDWEIFGVD